MTRPTSDHDYNISAKGEARYARYRATQKGRDNENTQHARWSLKRFEERFGPIDPALRSIVERGDAHAILVWLGVASE